MMCCADAPKIAGLNGIFHYFPSPSSCPKRNSGNALLFADIAEDAPTRFAAGSSWTDS
jgi:hypothetical protein